MPEMGMFFSNQKGAENKENFVLQRQVYFFIRLNFSFQWVHPCCKRSIPGIL